MTSNYSTIDWRETMNGVSIDCSLDIAIHPANSSIILLTVPGVDGSVDGYDNKYVRIADSIQATIGAAIVRIANPFITSFHWESNLRQALDYIANHAAEITNHTDYEIRLMAHSAGAAVAAQIAWEYPRISRLLLVNPATKLDIEAIKSGLEKLSDRPITILMGGADPNFDDNQQLIDELKLGNIKLEIARSADHNFSGENFSIFLESPLQYLFD